MTEDKHQVFQEIQLLVKEIINFNLLNQKKFLETGDKMWLTRSEKYMSDKYENLLDKYKKLGGIVIGIGDL